MDNKENIFVKGFVFPIGLSFIILGVPMILEGLTITFFGWTFPYFIFLSGVFMCWQSWNIESLDEIG